LPDYAKTYFPVILISFMYPFLAADAVLMVEKNGIHNYHLDETTELIHGIDNVINTEVQFFSSATKRIDTCMNYTRPELAIVLEPIRKAFLDAKGRNVGLRYITEVTKDNVSYCEELMTLVDELRHLEGIKGNFMLSETEYLRSPIILFEKGKIASQILYSNLAQIVQQ
jgi:two-component system, OmpR family, sensor histidine kinase VicK